MVNPSQQGNADPGNLEADTVPDPSQQGNADPGNAGEPKKTPAFTPEQLTELSRINTAVFRDALKKSLPDIVKAMQEGKPKEKVTDPKATSTDPIVADLIRRQEESDARWAKAQAELAESKMQTAFFAAAKEKYEDVDILFSHLKGKITVDDDGGMTIEGHSLQTYLDAFAATASGKRFLKVALPKPNITTPARGPIPKIKSAAAQAGSEDHVAASREAYKGSVDAIGKMLYGTKKS